MLRRPAQPPARTAGQHNRVKRIHAAQTRSPKLPPLAALAGGTPTAWLRAGGTPTRRWREVAEP
jgi:hypothetical protein